MSGIEAQKVKRPRLSLSCKTCRARKVRCGREQPECNNCVRMHNKCVYESLVRDELTGRLQQSSSSLRLHARNYRGIDPAAGFGKFRLTQSRPDGGDGSNTSMKSSSNSGLRFPQDAQLPLTKTHPKVPTREETIQGTDQHDSSGSMAPTFLSDLRPPSVDHGPDALYPGYLSLTRGGRVRYISKAFWGFLPGQECMSDDFFDENRNAEHGLPLPHIHAAELANLLKSLPNKPVCDALLEAFFIAVWPSIPLVHPVTLRADYDEFWEWCKNSVTSMPPAKIIDNPTFLCLLFSILLCGASAAPAVMWTVTSLQNLRKEITIDQLKSAYTASLSMCQHLEHPTFDTLVSTLLTAPFICPPSEQLHNSISISTIVRIAQTMGLHLESASSALDPITVKMRRRVWWHIVWMDVQSSISSGLPLCCGSDMQDRVSMMALARDEDIGSSACTTSPAAQCLEPGESITLIYAIGRCETAHLESKIVSSLQSAQGPTREELKELMTATKQLHKRIDDLISKIPTHESWQHGFIPSRWVNGSPLTHASLYQDGRNEPTVFAAWVRVMLWLLKIEVAILLQKSLLETHKPEKSYELRTWISISFLCMNYLSPFFRLYRTPAFAPYMWTFRTNFGPLQSTFMLLIYLRRFKQPPNDGLVRRCVDAAIARFKAEDWSANCGTSLANENSGSSDSRLPLAIQTLVDLYQRLESPSEGKEPKQSPVEWKDWTAACEGGFHGNMNEPESDMEFLTCLYDLQACSAQLDIESQEFSKLSDW